MDVASMVAIMHCRKYKKDWSKSILPVYIYQDFED